MFQVEHSAEKLLDDAETNYQRHFHEDFPRYEHIGMAMENGVVTLDGAQRYAEFLELCIDQNRPVPIPPGYDQRIY